MINRKREARQEGDHNATFPRRAVPVGLENAVDDSIADVIVYLHVVDHGPRKARNCLTPHVECNWLAYDVMKN